MRLVSASARRSSPPEPATGSASRSEIRAASSGTSAAASWQQMRAAVRAASRSAVQMVSNRRSASGVSSWPGGSQPARHAGRSVESQTIAHSRASGVPVVDRHLDRGAARAPRLGEVREHEGHLRCAAKVAPAWLGLAVVALALEGAEQQQVASRRRSSRPRSHG